MWKEIIEKTKLSKNSISKHVFHVKASIFDQKTLAEHFNTFFIDVGDNLQLDAIETTLKSYLTPNTFLKVYRLMLLILFGK